MTVVAHWPGGRGHRTEPSRWTPLLKALLTVLVVTAIVGATLGGVTYLASKAFISMLG